MDDILGVFRAVKKKGRLRNKSNYGQVCVSCDSALNMAALALLFADGWAEWLAETRRHEREDRLD